MADFMYPRCIIHIFFFFFAFKRFRKILRNPKQTSQDSMSWNANLQLGRVQWYLLGRKGSKQIVTVFMAMQSKRQLFCTQIWIACIYKGAGLWSPSTLCRKLLKENGRGLLWTKELWLGETVKRTPAGILV